MNEIPAYKPGWLAADSNEEFFNTQAKQGKHKLQKKAQSSLNTLSLLLKVTTLLRSLNHSWPMRS